MKKMFLVGLFLLSFQSLVIYESIGINASEAAVKISYDSMKDNCDFYGGNLKKEKVTHSDLESKTVSVNTCVVNNSTDRGNYYYNSSNMKVFSKTYQYKSGLKTKAYQYEYFTNSSQVKSKDEFVYHSNGKVSKKQTKDYNTDGARKRTIESKYTSKGVKTSTSEFIYHPKPNDYKVKNKNTVFYDSKGVWTKEIKNTYDINGKLISSKTEYPSNSEYTVISVDTCDLNGKRDNNVKIDVGVGSREYYAYTNNYGQLIKVEADEIILQNDSTENVNGNGRYCDDEAKVPGVESDSLDEGHVIADSLGGASNAYNITPQGSNVNRNGEQAKMEEYIRNAEKKGNDITDFIYTIEYSSNNSQIPKSYEALLRITEK